MRLAAGQIAPPAGSRAKKQREDTLEIIFAIAVGLLVGALTWSVRSALRHPGSSIELRAESHSSVFGFVGKLEARASAWA